MVDELKKQVYVEVISAIELDGGMIFKIKESIDKNTGLDARIRNTVDKSILGGIIIKIEGKVIDLSIRDKIDDLKTRLKSIELKGGDFGIEN